MKYDITKIIKKSAAILFFGAIFTSCSDFLNREPLDQISPSVYFVTADQLGGFTFNYYGTIFPNNSGWWAGQATFDDGTDNQASGGGNTNMFLQDQWRVPTSGGIGFNNIRNVNKFLGETLVKDSAQQISGSRDLINQYIGEAYFIRAMLYYDKLKTYGDYPILLKEINVDADLAAASKRMPRNEVAKQILSDLDKAIGLLQNNVSNNQRITKNAALVAKSRVALFEGTFEKYHKGTGRVPGDANWPGKDKDWNKGKVFDQNSNVNFFLDQAMAAAKQVADAVPLTTVNSHQLDPAPKGAYSGWNSYYDMFASPDLSKYPEVIMWKQFNRDLNVTHLTSNKLRTGSATGWSRSLVESFLMKNGLPIYAQNSGYNGDASIDLTKKDRDERLQLFVFGESNLLAIDANSVNAANQGVATSDMVNAVKFKVPNIVITNAEQKDITGYRQRKFYNYDPAMQVGTSFSDIDGQILFRVEEAMLNYMEACYIRTNQIDATAKGYWTALRQRSGITAPVETTINATDMAYEANVNRPSYDWGAFSAGNAIDATLYSIRRERRNELAGEGYRMDDLKRWAAMDQVKNYQIEGVNFWSQMYLNKAFTDSNGKSILIADGGDKANVSSKDKSIYLRPYQMHSNNNLFNGYTFYQAHYLSPFSVQEMQLASPDGNVDNSYLYQNIYWPTTASGMAEK